MKSDLHAALESYIANLKNHKDPAGTAIKIPAIVEVLESLIRANCPDLGHQLSPPGYDQANRALKELNELYALGHEATRNSDFNEAIVECLNGTVMELEELRNRMPPAEKPEESYSSGFQKWLTAIQSGEGGFEMMMQLGTIKGLEAEMMKRLVELVPDADWIDVLTDMHEKLRRLPPITTGMDQLHSDTCAEVANYLQRVGERITDFGKESSDVD